MKKLLLFCTLAALSITVDVKAEAVFDDAGTFQIARAKRMGSEKATVSHNVKQTAVKQLVCASGQYRSGKICKLCPEHSTCSGFGYSCNSQYYDYNEQCNYVCTGVSCVKGTHAVAKSDKCCCEPD